MRQNIIDSLKKLFSGTVDIIKIVYHTPKSHDVIKFTMLGHEIQEEDGLITVYDDRDNQTMPKMVNIDPLAVDSVTYEDNKADELGIHSRNVIIRMTDKGWIELGTMGMG